MERNLNNPLVENQALKGLKDLLEQCILERQLLDKKIENLEGMIKDFKEKVLNQEEFSQEKFINSVPVLKKVKEEMDEEHEEREEEEDGGVWNINKKLYVEYPHGKSKQYKVRYILKSTGKAMRVVDIERVIRAMESKEEATMTLRSFSHLLREMAEDGNLRSAMVANSKKHKFYILPEFLHGGKLKKIHAPEESSWGKLEESKRQEIYTAF